VRITLQYRQVWVEYFLQPELAEEFSAGLLRSTDDRPYCAQLLYLSMGGAFDQDTSKVVIGLPEYMIIADIDRVEAKRWKGRSDRVFVSVKRGGLLGSPGRTAQEHKALSERCVYSATQIVLDGRTLTGQTPSFPRLSEQVSSLPDYLTLAEGFLRRGSNRLGFRPAKLPVAILCDGEKQEVDPAWGLGKKAVFLRIAEPHPAAYFRLTSLSEPGVLIVVKDGVSLEPISKRSWLLGSIMAVIDDEIETDLSQMKARRSDNLRSLQDWADAQNRRVHGLLRDHLDALRLRTSGVLWERAKIAAAVGGFGFIMGIGGGPVCATIMTLSSVALSAGLKPTPDSVLRGKVRAYLNDCENRLPRAKS
jgi:hypothetical protein